ncbi:alpha/beta fold hydrolase [Streptomyces acidiscabies]|uniref:alpha/beta fold hydrolase n=1 Tax=Streptomyces acidiscabies TaxID=42234 RepID=UPI00095E2C4C|nr:alpha/beta hydrolase [Streptomyces acidiscabies]GAV45570.1 non-heme chloroperoxidase [Streptomyces acidiscabies]
MPPPPPSFLDTSTGTRLAYRDEHPQHPKQVPPFLLMHGLAGHMGEWNDLTTRLLTAGHRVIRYDAAGHGASTRTPPDMSRKSAAADATTLLTSLNAPPAILLGQSLGGVTALLTAATHPTLTHSLILVEAGPAQATPDLPDNIAAWLASWPTPFPSYQSAVTFFGHKAWTDSLTWHQDGTGHPRITPRTMLAATHDLTTHDHWPQWSQLHCPTLVVRGSQGTMPPSEPLEMQTRRPDITHLTTIPNAGHDVHLDRPNELYETVAEFVSRSRSSA